MSGYADWARRTVATARLSELALCTDRYSALGAADHPDVWSAEEIADLRAAAQVYAEELRDMRRVFIGGHVCSRCADVVVDA